MNKKQITVLWIGIIIIVLMGVFPPWYTKELLAGKQEIFGFSFILRPPLADIKNRVRYYSVINLQQLLIQWCIIGFMTFGYIVTYHDKT